MALGPHLFIFVIQMWWEAEVLFLGIDTYIYSFFMDVCVCHLWMQFFHIEGCVIIMLVVRLQSCKILDEQLKYSGYLLPRYWIWYAMLMRVSQRTCWINLCQITKFTGLYLHIGTVSASRCSLSYCMEYTKHNSSRSNLYKVSFWIAGVCVS